MIDEINYCEQISSKKHAVNKTTIKFFAIRRPEADVAYGVIHRQASIFGAAKTRVRFPPAVNF